MHAEPSFRLLKNTAYTSSPPPPMKNSVFLLFLVNERLISITQ